MLNKIKQTKLVGSIWKYIRERRILRQHCRVENFWKPFIADYYSGRLKKYRFEAKANLPKDKIIWQYWGQGMEDDVLPSVVRQCFKSVEKYKGDYEIVRLSDETIHEYIDLPSFIYERRNSLDYNRTFFSDLLRLALLATYGGVWLDATILLTGRFPKTYTDAGYFLFQRDNNEKNKSYWEDTYAYYWNWQPQFKVRLLNSIIFAKQGNIVIATMMNLILAYWEKQDKIIDYFFFQILYELLLEGPLHTERCALQSDVIPHMLQTNLNNPSNTLWSLEDALEASNLHKMAYYKADALTRFELFVYAYTKQ